MVVVSVAPVPVQGAWQQDNPTAAQKKEILGVRSIFHRHCGAAMRRVITFRKDDEGVHRIGRLSWICQVCEKREYPSNDM